MTKNCRPRNKENKNRHRRSCCNLLLKSVGVYVYNLLAAVSEELVVFKNLRHNWISEEITSSASH